MNSHAGRDGDDAQDINPEPPGEPDFTEPEADGEDELPVDEPPDV
ncbi:MAG: hypothetical protein UY92_C0006G0019 [Candidatus Magasanikbacteria bacterium GW2011_GWA2_56_11]|uniref:Uncharacterized protein n=1 Tax=Candidatus Magasanikbacteria bacterium GW2011_GWA2_56_11 TaxID=1619044 RepID=A0A0G1YG87_9BACT|nr:MAG: hypothetical protein UY92_C0006G0019 [Candidatus Magasanikbacteria bacterium GW2011_GWA2_56_11]